MSVLVFDIETIPDVLSARKLYNLHDLGDAEVADLMFAKQKEKNGSEFLPLHLQRIIVISAVFHNQSQVKVWSLGDQNASEKDIVTRFFDGIDKYTPTLVSWNGSAFDLPVLHYRALLNQVVAARYWEIGEHDQPFRWNNYLNRYHYRHLDVMDVLAAYNTRANAPLDEIALMLGCPGKMGMHGSEVWQYYQQEKIEEIRNYCETDVLNTYLVYLRFECMRGHLTKDTYEEICLQLKNYLKAEEKLHFNAFLEAWEGLPTP